MPPLLPRDVHVWFQLTASLDEEQVAAAVALLSADERARQGRFVFPRDRRDFAAAHALLRRVLSIYDEVPPTGWRFETTPEGKPYVASSPLRVPLAFNLSHTHGLVAAVIAGLDVAPDAGPDVGIDVESIDTRVHGRDVARRCFSSTENAMLDACADEERPARFIELWTLKEAYLKAIGSGLAGGLDWFEFAFDGSHGIRFGAPPGESAERWTFALFAPSPVTRIAVAIRGERDTRWQIVARSAESMDEINRRSGPQGIAVGAHTRVLFSERSSVRP